MPALCDASTMNDPDIRPPDKDPTYGDMFGGLQHKLSKQLMDAALRTDALLKGAIEGDEGPYDLSPEDAVRLSQEQFRIILTELQNIAGALDITRARLTQLERRLERGDE